MIKDGFSPIIQHAVSVLNGLDYVIYLFSNRWCGFFEGKDELRRRLVCFLVLQLLVILETVSSICTE